MFTNLLNLEADFFTNPEKNNNFPGLLVNLSKNSIGALDIGVLFYHFLGLIREEKINPLKIVLPLQQFKPFPFIKILSSKGIPTNYFIPLAMLGTFLRTPKVNRKAYKFNILIHGITSFLSAEEKRKKKKK